MNCNIIKYRHRDREVGSLLFCLYRKLERKDLVTDYLFCHLIYRYVVERTWLYNELNLEVVT